MSLAAQTTMTADFLDGSVSGRMYNWFVYGQPSVPVTGTLTMARGEIDYGADVRDDYTFAGNLTGTLNVGGSSASGYEAIVDGRYLGDFLGTNRQMIAGESFGDIFITYNGPELTEAAVNFDGEFIAD